MSHTPHTLVLDIGKSNAKLLLIAADGAVLARVSQANASVDSGLGYRALGMAALQDWLLASIPCLPERERIGRISISTHGAAFCAVDEHDLVLPPVDYEWDGYGEHRAAFAQAIDPFEHTGAPLLPLGLNAGLQLFWLQRTQPQAWARIRHWLPYPQYWAWWLTGVAASEVSSLGCHTQLWSPVNGTFSDWAQRAGIAARFAPLRRAWEVLGPIRTDRAQRLGLPAACEVVCGVHDSNACLARYLHHDAATLLTTGTWTIAMAAGGQVRELRPECDELLNVSVAGDPVPTARFMGGREFEVLCAGASPDLATPEALADVIAQDWQALPGFAEAGGPFQGQVGRLLQAGRTATEVPESLRPALASLYCAQMSQLLVQALSSQGPVILEGPLARNPVYGAALSALLGADRPLWRSVDALEGTARGAWLLARRDRPQAESTERLALISPPPGTLASAIRAHFNAWQAREPAG